MLKNLRIVFGVLGWIAGAVGFCLALSTSGLLIILPVWLMIGIAIFSYRIGLEKGKNVNGQVELPKLPGRYFIGIDLGRYKIKYCLIDYDKFEKNHDSHDVKIIEGWEKTPSQFNDIYQVLGNIIANLSKGAVEKNIHKIDGIGFGLPGQVNPRNGMLIRSPGLPNVFNAPFVPRLVQYLRENLTNMIRHDEILKDNFRIEIDNDVRCATRYLWKRMRLDDGICIFIGNGLGSGIVLGGQMLYGHDFMAGEIGHTTICSLGFDLLREEKCKCDKKGHHWEMYASSYGIINIAKHLNNNEYMRLKKNYYTIIKEQKYSTLLEEKCFKEHSRDLYDPATNELTSYFFSLAFHAGETYACEVVKIFIKYLAIGISNYINVINPQIVYLGGGMIEGFYTDKGPINTEDLLNREVDNYILPSAAGVSIQKMGYDDATISNIGAAFIFKDSSFFDYKKRT